MFAPIIPTEIQKLYCACLFFSCPIVPTAAPVSPSGYPVPDTSSLIFLSWSPVPAEHLNGILLFYLVDVTEVITNNSWTFHAVQTHIIIGPLHSFYTYRCRVAAFTTALGPFTPEFYVNSGETCGLHACMGWMYNKTIIHLLL